MGRALSGQTAKLSRLHATDAQLSFGGLAAGLNWDRDQLEQVVANLAGNAAQYGREGAPILVEVSSSQDDAQFEIRNENRGEPIPAEMWKTIFDPFERSRTAGSAEGLGLGLYIAQQIVRTHGGTIAVTSNTAGTTFRVTLPTKLN